MKKFIGILALIYGMQSAGQFEVGEITFTNALIKMVVVTIIVFTTWRD